MRLYRFSETRAANERGSVERFARPFETALTDLEAVFRSLKSELGLRPVHHHKPIRAQGRLFITVPAYRLAQVHPHPATGAG